MTQALQVLSGAGKVPSGPPPRKANPYAKKAVHARRGETLVPAKPGGIQDRALLVALTVKRWHIGRNERLVESKVASENGAEVGMMSVRKKLVRKDAISELRIIEADLRSWHHLLTSPWDDSGYRILSNAGYLTYVKKINELMARYSAAADLFVNEQYDDLKIDARKRLGKLYHEADYPSKKALRAMYQARIHPASIQSGEDFRVQMGDAEVSVIRKQITADVEEKLERSHRSVWERLAEVLTHAVERLKKYSVDADGKVNHPFRESLVGNIKELLDIVPVLNVFDDEKLTEFTVKIRAEIAGYSAEVLRDDAAIRAKVIDAADDILDKIRGFMA